MRMLRSALAAAILAVVVTTATPVAAAPIPIDFENLPQFDFDFPDVTPLQFAGVTISGAGVLTSDQEVGGLLNASDYPPNSGLNVVFNLLSEMRLVFDDEVSSVGGYFTYSGALTLSAFDASNNLLGAASSLYDANHTHSLNPASNELLQITSTQAIAYVTIASASGPGMFVLDDLSFEVAEDGGGGDPNPPVPEPATVSLVLLGAAVAAGRQKLRARRQAHV